MDITRILNELFPSGHDTIYHELFFSGSAHTSAGRLEVIGTPPGIALNAKLSLDLAGEVIRILKDHPGSPILLLIDTKGQALSRREEMLGLNRYLAHLAKCIYLARSQGHHMIGLVYGQCVSGGALATSLFANECYAVPEAEITAMNLPAMARVTRIPLERLQELSLESPVFSPSSINYLKMGALRGIWDNGLAASLEEALQTNTIGDERRLSGAKRGGRLMAWRTAESAVNER